MYVHYAIVKPSSLIGHTVEILADIDRSPFPADSVIATHFRSRKYLGSRDRRFISEAAYGVLRHRRTIDAYLNEIPGALDGSTREGIAFLRLAAYVLSLHPDSSVSSSDFLSLLDGETLKGKLTFVLSRLAAGKPPPSVHDNPAVEYSFEDWMVEKLRHATGETGLRELLGALNKQAPIAIRVNTLKGTIAECQARLREEGVESTKCTYSPVGLMLTKRVNVFGLASFKEGWFEVQDEGSQLLPLLIDPKPTSRILDMCAGAGGKTLAFSALMKNRGEIVATDVSEARLKELRRRATRAGAHNIRVREDPLSFSAVPPEDRFDIVFVDAPCTGIGTVRRNPGMKWSVTASMVAEMAKKQSTILRTAAGAVKGGGKLVYATCSLFREENEEVIDAFLRESGEFRREDLAGRSTHLGIPDALGGSDIHLRPDVHGTDGFFCSFLVREDV